ncbi:hypothetical protein F5I97DRAFT_1930058 [Phlebopus sp. FC_14]|nr:hypothetical protein F5I97DRAFT_1930058 [Phlebopus sp. FC_14]
MSAWHFLEQPPPPTLREILGAYRSRGDGDRDMLLAMLNAKSAEDQRIAAVASLHRTLLDLSIADAGAHPSPALPYRHPSQSNPIPHIPSDTCSQCQPPRKRHRSARSPPRHDVRPSHTSSRDLPPSPYSSHSDSEEYSPRSRASMAIGSLLSTDPTRDPDDAHHEPIQSRLPSSGPIGVSA